MKNYIIIITLSSLILLGMVACNGENGISAKKAELESLKREQAEISSKIKTLEEEIALSGDSSKTNEKSKIVGVTAVKFESFNKYYYFGLLKTVSSTFKFIILNTFL